MLEVIDLKACALLWAFQCVPFTRDCCLGRWEVWELSHLAAAGRLDLLSNSTETLLSLRVPVFWRQSMWPTHPLPLGFLPLLWPFHVCAGWHLWLYPSISRTQEACLVTPAMKKTNRKHHIIMKVAPMSCFVRTFESYYIYMIKTRISKKPHSPVWYF